jgi:rhodanese-related sulfurtransferase
MLPLLPLLSIVVTQVKMVSPQEVQFASDRGALIVDVRPEADYDAVSQMREAAAVASAPPDNQAWMPLV